MPRPAFCPGPNPYRIYCEPDKAGLGNWGYSTSPLFGDCYNGDPDYGGGLRGMFSRLGAKVRMASAPDGLSNTILIGETLGKQNAYVRAWSAPNSICPTTGSRGGSLRCAGCSR